VKCKATIKSWTAYLAGYT